MLHWLFNKLKQAWGRMTGSVKMVSKADTAVVCVGMETSRTYGACPGARVDSNVMSRVLLDYGHVRVLQDRVATVDAVIHALDDALQAKLCIFYYSGHGGQKKDKAGENGVSEFLCLDNGPLPDYKLWEMLQAAKGRVFMIFDCCHSATMFRGASISEGSTTLVENVGFKFQLLRSTSFAAADASGASKNFLVWSGCPANDYSYGDSDGGVFTNGIRKGLRSDATYDSVWACAERFAKSQHPVRTVVGSGFNGPVFR